MKRKLMALNLVLIAMLGFVWYRFQQTRQANAQREARVLGERVPNKRYPALARIPPVAPTVAANYLDVAQRMLLARDRNPTVIIDPEPVKAKPPMPPMPVVHGLMTLGEPGIILSEKPGAEQRTYHAGDKVGPFKLLAFDSTTVQLDWDGEKVNKKLQDLWEKGEAPSAAAGGAAGNVPPPPSAVSAANAPAPSPTGPGIDIGGGFKSCQPNDSTPTGTVQSGLRKVELQTPFGRSCRWEPAR